MTTSHGSQLTPPVGDHDHVQGPSSAPVTLVEYGDYECPYCRAAYPIVKEIQRRLGDRLRFVFRNFLITTAHPHADHAAEAAEAAGAQGKFWEMHDSLFEHQRALGDRHLEAYAGAVRLDVERWASDMEAQRHAERVRADFVSGVRSGVNGRRHDGAHDMETLTAAIEAAVLEPTR
jgi:predicted DsbA family dithiol-disulfide isomerase